MFQPRKRNPPNRPQARNREGPSVEQRLAVVRDRAISLVVRRVAPRPDLDPGEYRDFVGRELDRVMEPLVAALRSAPPADRPLLFEKIFRLADVFMPPSRSRTSRDEPPTKA